MKSSALLLFLVGLLVLQYYYVNVNAHNVINLYISTDGSDNNIGNSTTSPFSTISKASTWIQNYKNNVQKENTTFIVNIDDGRYFVNSTITIGKPNKFNDKYSPVYWKPLRKGGQVTFTGGVPLPPALWSTVSNQDPLYDIIPAIAKGSILKINLTSVGFSSDQIVALKSSGFSVGSITTGNEIFFQRKAQTIARFPNKLGDDEQFLKFITADVNGLNFTFNSTTSNNRINWAKEPHPFAAGYFFWDWADCFYPLKSIASSGFGEFIQKYGYGLKVGQRVALVNFLSELDQPGEYVILDGVIYFWPPSPISKSDDVIISVSEHIWDIKANAQFVSNINFEMCRGIAVRAEGLRDVMVNFTTLSNIGNRGISLSSCYDNCNAVSNVIYETGQGGITIGGGDRYTLTSSNSLVMNNTIFNYSRIGKTYRPAIGVDGVGVSVKNNEIYNADHVGILWGGNNHDFAYNKIHDICKSTGDSGAIYSGRDWTMRGNTIRYNHIYNVNGPGDLGTTCIYLDDQFSSVTMYGNILTDCYRGFLIGGGRDNIIYGNVFVNNTVAILADDRGLTWANTAEINQKLKVMPINSTIWVQSYPNLQNILNDEPNAPKGNIVTFNVFVGKTNNQIYANFKKYSQYSNNTEDVPETIFVNAQQRNFTVTDSASAQYLMNVKIPFSNIGLLPREQNSIITPTTSTSSIQPTSSNKNGTVVSQAFRVGSSLVLLFTFVIGCL